MAAAPAQILTEGAWSALDTMLMILFFVPKLAWGIVRMFTIFDILKLVVGLPLCMWACFTAADYSKENFTAITSVASFYKNFFDGGLQSITSFKTSAQEVGTPSWKKSWRDKVQACSTQNGTNPYAQAVCTMLPADWLN